MGKPAVTVFIPTFNRLTRLKTAVRSVLDQGDFVRLHVLDNASPDGTAEWLKELRESDARVQVTLREQNVGGYRNFFEGFQAVETPYLVPLADDDELAPGFLPDALQIVESRPTLGAVVFTTEIRRNGRAVGFSPSDSRVSDFAPDAHLMEWGKTGHYISWSSILWRREPIQQLAVRGEFERFGLPSDIWMQFLVFCESPVHLDSRIGSIFNNHEGQASSGIGLHSISQYGAMVAAMEHHLAEKNLLSGVQSRLFLANVCRSFNGNLRYYSALSGLKPQDNDLRKWIENYFKYIYPHVGFEGFPFLGAFDEHKLLRDQIEHYIKSSGSLKELAKAAYRIIRRRAKSAIRRSGQRRGE